MSITEAQKLAKGSAVKLQKGKRQVPATFIEVMPGSDHRVFIQTAASRRRGAAGYGGYDLAEVSDVQAG